MLTNSSINLFSSFNPEKLEGVVVDHYQLLKILGSGAMSVVYQGKYLDFDSLVAIKVLRPELIRHKDVRYRFLQEGTVQFQLQHPNIARVLKLLKEGNFMAMVVDWIDGEDFASYLDKHAPLAPEKVGRFFLPLLDALHYAHEHQIIHRDIKPSNIIIDKSQGQEIPKLVDFGIAKALSDSQFRTQTGIMLGTPYYMAPEYMKTGKVDHRADIYAMGVMLFEVLTNKLPFGGDESKKIIGAHLLNPIPKLNGIMPKHPLIEPFNDILQKALAKNPDERYSTCLEFKKDLEELLLLSEKKVVKQTEELIQVTTEQPTLSYDPDEQVKSFGKVKKKKSAHAQDPSGTQEKKPSSLRVKKISLPRFTESITSTESKIIFILISGILFLAVLLIVLLAFKYSRKSRQQITSKTIQLASQPSSSPHFGSAQRPPSPPSATYQDDSDVLQIPIMLGKKETNEKKSSMHEKKIPVQKRALKGTVKEKKEAKEKKGTKGTGQLVQKVEQRQLVEKKQRVKVTSSSQKRKKYSQKRCTQCIDKALLREEMKLSNLIVAQHNYNFFCTRSNLLKTAQFCRHICQSYEHFVRGYLTQKFRSANNKKTELGISFASCRSLVLEPYFLSTLKKYYSDASRHIAEKAISSLRRKRK